MYITDTVHLFGIKELSYVKDFTAEKNLKFITAFKILNIWIYPKPFKSRLKSTTFFL
jgi:hypothetical protein